MRLPVDFMYGGSEIRKTGDEYVDDVRRNKENAHNEVRERTKTVTGRLLQQASVRGTFKKDDRVWVHQPCTGKTISMKFYQPWSGRYRAIKRISDTVYRVQLIGGR